MRLCGEFVPGGMITSLGWLNWLSGPVQSMKRIAGKLDEVMQSWIEEHKLKRTNIETALFKGEKQSDFIDVTLSEIDPDFCDEYSPETVIKATAMTLILAGAETTFVTMTWMLSNLLNNRGSMELAQQELDTKVGRTRTVEPSDIENLVYIQAIVKETLRLYPAAPVGVPHEAIEECIINGYKIPKNTRIFTNLWKLHRDPNVWSDPEEFKPERFLEEKTNNSVIEGLSNNVNYSSASGQNHFEYIPFGSGRRSCPGMGFALQVMNLTLARLLQSFSLTTPGDDDAVDMGEGMGLTLPKATPLEVRIVPRLLPPLYE